MQFTSFRDVGSSFSYSAPTNWMQVNFWQFDKGPWPRSCSSRNFSAPCIMRLKMDFLPSPKKALPISHSARQYFMISIVCCSFVRLVNKMLTGILLLIATSYANSTREKDLICSFLSMMRKLQLEKENLYLDILQQLRHVSSLVFASSRSSKMSVCSSLVALMGVSFSPWLFLFNWFYPFLLWSRCNKLQGCP